jgi:hypothetical protein
MTPFDGHPRGPKGDPLEDLHAQPEKTDRLRIQAPSAFVKRLMRERKDGGIVTFVRVRSGRIASQVERDAGTDPTTVAAPVAAILNTKEKAGD